MSVTVRHAVAAALAGALLATAAPAQELSEVTVTGSRIQVTGMQTPTPVTAISTDDLAALSPTTLVEALVQLPQFLGSDTPQSQSFASSGAAGASFINLRSLGANRTLTLLDGRRVVPATRGGAVDVALLPSALVQRVEVVTGGASAAYGSDAVSGVVNFILDTKFTGFKANAQFGVTEIGDNDNYTLELAGGFPIGDHAHLILSAEGYKASPVTTYRDRDWFQSWAVIGNTPANYAAGGPLRVTVPNVRSGNSTYGGLITSGVLAGTQFLRGGVPAPFTRGNYSSTATHSGGSGIDTGADVWLMPAQTRGNGFAHLDVDVTDNVTAYVQGMVGYSSAMFEAGATTMSTPWEATIYRENPFLPASLVTRMTAANQTSFTLGRMGSPEDLGNALIDNRSNLKAGTVGFKARLGDVWRADGYYQHGQNDATLRYTNITRIDHLYRAIDAVLDPATGRVVCRSTLTFPNDGCVPMNILGEGSPSPEAIKYVNGDITWQAQTIKQQVAEVNFSGAPFSNWADKVSFAFGAAWRRETLHNRPYRYPSELDAITSVPSAASQGYRGLPAAYATARNIFERTSYATLDGAYDVTEGYIETVFPLLRNLPGAQSVDFSGAWRWADYSGSGGIPAWKLGLDWQVFEPLRLRATLSRDVRAGSLSQRFDSSGTGGSIRDPLRAPTDPAYAITSFRGGNPNIDPEQADTFTAGFVLSDVGLEGFSFSADYFDIRIRKAISQLSDQQIVDQCFQGATALCGRITRSPATNLVVSIDNTFLNINEARSSGVDFELGYQRPISLFGGEERIAFRAFTTWMRENSTSNLGAITYNRAGQTGGTGGIPRWQSSFGVNYLNGPLTVTLQERYIGRGTYNVEYGPRDIDDNVVGGVFYTNARLSWDLSDQLTLYGNITNLFDRAPPLAPNSGTMGTSHTNESLFDALGRRYTIGVRMQL